jgi:hypothetical protein
VQVKHYQFIDSTVETDTLDVREAFGGGVILDAWNADSYGDGAGATSIELDELQVIDLIGALIDVAKIDALDLIAAVTGATFEVAA